MSRSKEFFRSNEKKGESKGKKFCGGRLWPRESRVLTGHRKLKEGERERAIKLVLVAVCLIFVIARPRQLLLRLALFFFFLLLFS